MEGHLGELNEIQKHFALLFLKVWWLFLSAAQRSRARLEQAHTNNEPPTKSKVSCKLATVEAPLL